MAISLRKLIIMWVEDQIEPFIAGSEVLGVELSNCGFEEVVEGNWQAKNEWQAKTLEEAESKLDIYDKSTLKPDVILLDLMLPQDAEELNVKKVDLDGGYFIWFEIRKMQKWPTLVNVPVLIITARGRPEYRDQVVADSATRWLSKPADPSKVAENIKELLAPSEAASQLYSEQLPNNNDEDN